MSDQTTSQARAWGPQENPCPECGWSLDTPRPCQTHKDYKAHQELRWPDGAAPSTQRTCGNCTECCFVCPVEALDKPLMTRCDHQREGGCKIYPDRPGACRHYQCSWLTGEFADEHRPDRSGVLFEHTELQDDDGGHCLTILLGMAYREDADVHAFLRFARPGKLVAIAGGITGNQDKDIVAGQPADVQTWLEFMARARTNGHDCQQQPNQRASIRIRKGASR